MHRTGRLLVIAALFAASVSGVLAPVHIAPKNCTRPGVVQPDLVCGAVCPGIPGCRLQVCARECDTSFTCYYSCG